MSEEGLINIKCMLITHLLSALFIPAYFMKLPTWNHSFESRCVIHKVWSSAILWKRMLLLLLWQYLKLFHLHHSLKLFSCTSSWKLSHKYYWVTSNIYCSPPRCGRNVCKKRSLKNFYFLECVERFIKLFIRHVIEWKLHCNNAWNNILAHF